VSKDLYCVVYHVRVLNTFWAVFLIAHVYMYFVLWKPTCTMVYIYIRQVPPLNYDIKLLICS